MNMRLRVEVPYVPHVPLHPSAAHLMSVRLERVADVFTLSIRLWLVGVPRVAQTHSSTAGSVGECIDEVEASILQAPPDDRTRLLRGAATAGLVKQCLRRVLLGDEPAGVDVCDASSRDEALATQAASVLLVEDNDPVRDLVQLMLQAAGFDVHAAACGAAALQACQPGRFDIAVVDVNLGSESGIALAQQMRERSPMRVLFVSGAPLDAGVHPPGAFLLKPFSRTQIVSAIRALLGQAGDHGASEGA